MARDVIQFRGRRKPLLRGQIVHGRGQVVVEFRAGGAWQPLPTCNHVRNHSPGGFEWGYGGSGPAQLALAMCCAVWGETLGQERYQIVKVHLVAALPFEEWICDERDLAQAVERDTEARLRRRIGRTHL